MNPKLTELDWQRHEEATRAMISEENKLVNERISWMMTGQGLLFAAMTFAWDKQSSGSLIIVLCLLGMCLSIVSAAALTGATRAMSRLYLWWELNKPKDYQGPGVRGLPLEGWIGLYVGPWTFIPLFFMLAWAVVLWVSWGMR